jgi:hypothetical protein
MTSIAIVQSNYIPFAGYFELIAAVDQFVILDTVQFTKNDWRNRNRIRGARGPQWLTIPIRTAGRLTQRICEAEVADPDWSRRHWRTLVQAYGRTPGALDRLAELERAYEASAETTRLSTINRRFLELACRWLGITTPLATSDAFPDHPDRVQRLIGMCRAAGARRYVSGPRARAYLDLARFEAAGIEVCFHEYADQATPRLSVIDTCLRS